MVLPGNLFESPFTDSPTSGAMAVTKTSAFTSGMPLAASLMTAPP
jgi:hypothetical protein